MTRCLVPVIEHRGPISEGQSKLAAAMLYALGPVESLAMQRHTAHGVAIFWD